MTMHMERAHLNNNGSGKGKKSPNTAAKRKAEVDHQAWLRSQGVHPTQLEKRKLNFKVAKPAAEPLAKPAPQLSNNLRVTGGFKRSIMDRLDEESPETRKAILDKASRLAPLYNKGAIQYVSPGEDLTQIGSKSRRG